MTLEEVERWFAYRDNRNDTHDYGEGFANATLNLLPAFIVDVRTLELTLRARFTGSARTRRLSAISGKHWSRASGTVVR